ncbi:MAG: hypothetical protein R3B70_25195 [Polyangiaceae bacterium]
MRISHTIVAASLTTLASVLAFEQPAAAQPAGDPVPVQPQVARDQGWGAVSDVALTIGVLSPFLMPRVYYSDPTSTVGWKGRWHVSMLAPAMTMLGATLLVDIPIKNEAKGARPGCDASNTQVGFPGSGCETFGGPSTHMFATYGALGTGTAIFLVDTFKYSDGRFSAPAFIGNVGIPLVASVLGTVGRSFENSADVRAFEDPGQVAAGAISGLLTGAAVGVTYAILQRPSCGYGDAVICW